MTGGSSVRMTRRQFNAAVSGIGLSVAGRRAAPATESTRSAFAPGVAARTGASTKVIAGAVAGVLKRHLLTGYLVGAVALIGHGESAEVVLIGDQSKETGERMRRDCIFRIASMTEPLTTAAAHIAIEHNLLHPNDPVSRWLPELDDRHVLRQL